MTQDSHSNLILDSETIRRKLRRMAYEIYERNTREHKLILAGILDRGHVVASQLAGILKEIAPFDLQIVNLIIDRQLPAEVSISENIDFTGKVVIVVDDVANSGRTMLYAMKPILEYLPKKIQTAVLVDRMHKSFPIVVNYTGHSLSTTLQENIRVEISGSDIRGAYLS
jgi:pyrimidine operon attenuation protein/uracil phosphoribosyltransferase